VEEHKQSMENYVNFIIQTRVKGVKCLFSVNNSIIIGTLVAFAIERSGTVRVQSETAI
jgi:hypothetical protein